LGGAGEGDRRFFDGGDGDRRPLGGVGVGD
jgi:hypothetical protein